MPKILVPFAFFKLAKENEADVHCCKSGLMLLAVISGTGTLFGRRFLLLTYYLIVFFSIIFLIGFFGQDYFAAAPESTTAGYHQELKSAKDHLGDDDPRLAPLYNNVGESLRREGKLDGAIAQFDQALALVGPEDAVSEAIARNNLALIHLERDELVAADRELEQAYFRLEGMKNLDHPVATLILNNRATLSQRRGDLDTAILLQLRAYRVGLENRSLTPATIAALKQNLDELLALKGIIPQQRAPDDPVLAVTTGTPSSIATSGTAPGASPQALNAQQNGLAHLLPVQSQNSSSINPTGLAQAVGRQEVAVADLPTKDVETASVRPAADPAPSSTEAATDGYSLHVGSIRSQPAADDEWERLQSRYTALDGIDVYRAEPIDVEGRGRFYRLLAGDFQDRQEAENVCGAIQAADGYCRIIN